MKCVIVVRVVTMNDKQIWSLKIKQCKRIKTTSQFVRIELKI